VNPDPFIAQTSHHAQLYLPNIGQNITIFLVPVVFRPAKIGAKTGQNPHTDWGLTRRKSRQLLKSMSRNPYPDYIHTPGNYESRNLLGNQSGPAQPGLLDSTAGLTDGGKSDTAPLSTSAFGNSPTRSGSSVTQTRALSFSALQQRQNVTPGFANGPTRVRALLHQQLQEQHSFNSGTPGLVQRKLQTPRTPHAVGRLGEEDPRIKLRAPPRPRGWLCCRLLCRE